MDDPYIHSVREELTRLLAPIGIELEQDAVAAEGDRIVWRRENSWKIDAVELVREPASSQRLFISCSVYLKGTGIPERLFDGFTLKGRPRGSSSFTIPSGLSRKLWAPARFAASVAKKTESELPWFKDLASPEACLRRLRNGKTNGAGSSGKAFEIIEATLEELASSEKLVE